MIVRNVDTSEELVGEHVPKRGHLIDDEERKRALHLEVFAEVAESFE